MPLLLGLFALLVGLWPRPALLDPPGPAPVRPNVIVILTDDMDVDLFDDEILREVMPTVYHRLKVGGMTFANYQTTTPLCGPSRASTLRGQYAHNTRIYFNDAADGPAASDGLPTGGFEAFWERGYFQDELGVWMREAGYYTAVVGKYHNNRFPVGSGSTRPHVPGWDDYRFTVSARYFGDFYYTNGDRGQYPDDEYRADSEGRQAIEALERRAPDRPFFLYYAPFAPHYGTGEDIYEIYPERLASFYEGRSIPPSPDFNEADISDKPSNIQVAPLLSDARIEYLNEGYRARARALRALDDSIADLFDYLDANGLSDETLVFFGSDNGFQLGHHRLNAKKSPYVRSTSVPFLVAGPSVESGSVRTELVGNIDLAPTLLAIAGRAPKPHFDGASFLPLLRGETPAWREEMILEQWEFQSIFGVRIDMRYTALRREDEVYVAWTSGEREYYDLTEDPYQLENSYTRLTEDERATFEATLSRLSTPRSMSSPGQGDNPSRADLPMLSAAPNPSADGRPLELTLTAPTSGPIEVLVYDMLGRLVRRASGVEVPEGTSTFALPPSPGGYRPGTYVISVRGHRYTAGVQIQIL